MSRLQALVERAPLALTATLACFGFGLYGAAFEYLALDFRVLISIAAAITLYEQDQAGNKKDSFLSYLAEFVVIALFMSVPFVVGFFLGGFFN